MIRDPSDGTVREKPENPIKPYYDSPEKAAEAAKFYRVVPDTGLRQPTRTDAQLRLERSREWLKAYFSKKEREHAGDRGADTAPETGLRNDRGGPD